MDQEGADWNCKFFYCILQPGDTFEASQKAVETHASAGYTGLRLQDDSTCTLADAVKLVKREVQFGNGDQMFGLGSSGWVNVLSVDPSKLCKKGTVVHFKVVRGPQQGKWLQQPQSTRRSLEEIFKEWQSDHAGFILHFANQPTLPQTSLGVTASRDGRPSLLLHALKDQWTKNSVVWRMVEAGRRCIPLMGVSGCGKTRILYELLAQYWGFYFTASTTRNGGSTDVSLVGREVGGEDPGSVKHYAAAGFMSKLILARLLILQYARSIMPDLTPEQWLLLQTEFWRYVPAGENVDPYQALGLMLDSWYDSGKEWELYNLWRKVVSELNCRPIFIMDEAQNLQSANCFLSPDALQLRPRFSPIVKALLSNLLGATVCIAGTGISFLQLEESTRSLVAKDGAGYPQFVTEFDRWDLLEEVYNFCERYLLGLGLTRENCSRLLDRFGGRKRCLVTCLERLMLNGAWSMPEVDRFYAELTTKNSLDYPMSLYTVVAQFFQSGEGTFRCRGEDLSASALVKRIVDHHLFSRRVALVLESSEDHLVQCGIGWCSSLATQGEASTYVVDERMVMDAMVNYCQEHGHIESHLKPLMDSHKDDPGACGIIWEGCHAG